MSISNIRTYFTFKLQGQGLEEWGDGFGEDNIPNSILDRSFHQRFISASGAGVNQESFEMIVIHQIKIYFKGFKDPAQAIEEGLVQSQSVIATLLNLKDYTDYGLTGLFFDGFTLEPFEQIENDNIVVATLNFSILVFNCIT